MFSVWKNIPIFFIWLTGLSMTDTALHQVIPALTDVPWLGVIPLVTSLILLAMAQVRQQGGFRCKGFLPWVAVLAGAYVIPFISRSSVPLSLETNRVIFEASAIIEFIIFALHGRIWLKGWDWIWIFVVTLIFGAILENGGILMGFFTEKGYLLYVFGLSAPVATVLGWVNVLYCGFFVVERVLPKMRPVLKGLVCAGIAMSMDIPFDPVATRLSWWVWNDTLTANIWGVPIVNYVAWFWALFPYSWCYYRVRCIGRMEEGAKMVLFSALIPLILLVELGGVVISLIMLGDQQALEIVSRFFKILSA
jgi:uncharacterized membrane protein